MAGFVGGIAKSLDDVAGMFSKKAATNKVFSNTVDSVANFSKAKAINANRAAGFASEIISDDAQKTLFRGTSDAIEKGAENISSGAEKMARAKHGLGEADDLVGDALKYKENMENALSDKTVRKYLNNSEMSNTDIQNKLKGIHKTDESKVNGGAVDALKTYFSGADIADAPNKTQQMIGRYAAAGVGLNAAGDALGILGGERGLTQDENGQRDIAFVPFV